MSDAQLHPPVAAHVLAEYREGLRRQSAGDLAGALRHLQNALRLCGSEHPRLLEALGVLAAEGGDLRAAEKILRRVQALRPDPQTLMRLALVVYRQNRFADAVPLFASCVPKLPYNADLAEAWAFALENTGDYARSAALFEETQARAPSEANAVRWAAALMRHGEQDRLAALLPGLIARYPRAQGLLELECALVLGRGDYPRGFALQRARHEALGSPEADQRLAALPRWDGRPFAGTLLLSLENHVGEEIMVSSLLSVLVARGQQAAVEVDPRFLSLFARTWPSLRFVPRQTGQLAACMQPGQAYARAYSVDLLQYLDRRCTLPGAPGWLLPDAARTRALRNEYHERWPGQRLVGISWRSSRPYNGVDAKSVPLAALPRALATPGTVFISLQYGDVAAECASVPHAPWRDARIDARNDFEALSAQVAALDQVVTVSNVAAHLAGALGVPTTLLLPKRFPVLWQWGYQGDECSWYGSMRILRNPRDTGFEVLDTLLADDLAGTRGYAGPDLRPSS